MAINWAERLDNIKNNVKSEMESTSTNRWAAILDQGRAKQKFQGLQIKLSDFENSKSGFEKSANSFTSGWQDEKSTNNFYSSFGNFYAEAEAIRQDLEENAAAYKSILGDEKYKTIYDSFNAVSKNKDSDLEGFKRRGDLYSKYKTADEYNKAYRTSQIGSKYDNIKTFEDYNKYIKSGNFEQADMPKDEKDYLLRLGYALEYQETLSLLNSMKQRLEGLPKEFTANKTYNPQEIANNQAERKQLEQNIKKAEARIKEMDNMGGVYTGLNTQITSESGEYAFDQRWSAAKKEMEDFLELTPSEKRRKMSGQKVEGKEIVIDDFLKKAKSEEYTNNYLHYLTEDEQKLYSYIKQTDGEKAAQTYLEELKVAKLDKRLNQALFQKMSDFASKSELPSLFANALPGVALVSPLQQKTGNAEIASLASVPMSVLSGLEFAAYRLGGEKFDGIRSTLATQSQGFREGTKTHWDGAWGEKVWDFLYDTGMSGVDSAAAAGLSAVVPYLGEVLLGGSAAAATYNDALDRGISHGDAMLTALTAGVAESLFEHMSISKFLDAGDITKGFTKSGLRQATKTLLTEMGVNFTEELFTEVSNIITDTAINGNLSNYAIAVKDYYMQGMSPEEAKEKALGDFKNQILEAGLSGALMGFGFGSISSIKGMAHSQVLNSRNGGLVKLSGNVAELKTVAELSNNEEIKAAAEKLTETSKPSEIGYVYNSLVADAVEQSVEQMTPVLLENGAKESGSNSAKGWATQIANSLFDKNEGKKAELSINKVTSEVYSDFITEGKYGGDKLLNLKDIISTPYLNQKTTASEVGTVLNENGIEAPVAADGSGAAIGPVMGDTVKGIAAAPRSGEIRTITEAYKQGVAENLEKQRPNPKTMSEEEIMKTYFAEEVQISPEEEEVLKDFGKANGLEVDFVDGAVNGKGYGVFQNGKQIVISRYAKKPMATLFKHEFTHSIEKAKGYVKFQKYVLEESKAFKGWLNVKGFENWKALSNSVVKNYKESGVDYEDPYIKAKADIIADFVGDVLFGEVIDAKGNPIKLDTNFLVELKKNDRNLFQRFVEWVHSILKRLTTKGVVNRDIVKLEQKFKRLAEQARQQRAKGESENNQTSEADEQDTLAEKINESTQKVGVEYDAETDSVSPQYSLASWQDSDYVKDRNKAAQEIADAIGVSKKTAIKYINSINSIAKIIADDKVRLDYDPATGKSSFVSNVEYGGSIDFSTLCQKRKWLTGTFSAIQRELKNSALTASEVLKIRNMLKEKGIEVSCGLCYVEGSRAEMGVFAKQFIERYKKTNPDFVPDMADVNTPEGVEALRVNHPEVYEAYEKFWNNKGVLNEGDSVLFASQRKPKLYSVRTDYKHEILDKFKNEDNVAEKNKNGGLRIQSFSDFEIVHLIDMMQVIMDMSKVGLAGQAYTKVPDFALALGDTGLKINLSLIAKGVDANGNLIFDDVEGMPIDTAMRIRNMYSKNVGTVLVIFNDVQLKAALKDDRVDFIIPFHRSQWKRSQYAELGLPKDTKDYTYMQNERYIKPVYYTTLKGTQGKRKATNYMPIKDYWDFDKSGKENAESYLKLCAENNKRPKFYKLLVDNKDGSYSLQPDGSTDGYWKLLIDFKMYDNNGKGSPQLPVKPTFNMEESMRMLEEYKGDHTSFPADQETVDTFVKEYKSKHKLDNFTESNRGKVEIKGDYDIGSYSLPDLDSTGQKLSAGQMEYFRDSKAVDGKGNLLVLYHGTPNGGFFVFDPEDSYGKKPTFLTNNIQTANSYIDEGKNHNKFIETSKKPEALRWLEGDTTKPKGKKGLYKVYANVTNPLIVDCKGGFWNNIPFGENEVYKVSYVDGEVTIEELNSGETKTVTFTERQIAERTTVIAYFERLFNKEMAEDFSKQMKGATKKSATNGMVLGNFTWDSNRKRLALPQTTNSITRMAKKQGYDGVIFKNIHDHATGGNPDNFDLVGQGDTVVAVFDSNQIKDVNNTNPTENKDIRYSLPDLDTEYMKAVESGDMETAQRMVDEAAKRAGYFPVIRYHQTGIKFTRFSNENPDAALNDSDTPNGYFFKDNNHDIGVGADFVNTGRGGSIQMPVYLKHNNLLYFENREVAQKWYSNNVPGYSEILNKYNEYLNEYKRIDKENTDKMFDELNALVENGEDTSDKEMAVLEKYDKIIDDWIASNEKYETSLRSQMRQLLNEYFIENDSVYDGIELADDGHRYIDGKREDVHTYIVFKNTQIKSADPVTYDDKGNVIPLSERFNTENVDIRYSLPDIPDIARGKSNAELEQLIKDGKITLDDAVNSLDDQYGTMPKGENPKVDVDVPNKVSDTKGVRRFARTALESGHLTEGMSEDAKREIINGALNYEISSNKMVTNIAEKKVAKDINKAIQEWEGLIASGRIPTAGEIALGEVLLVEAAKADNANDVAMYLSELAALGTQLGQGIQALSLLKKLTGVGQLHYVSRVIAQMNEDLKRRYGDKFQDVLSIDPNLEEILAKSKSQAEIEEVIDDILTDVAKQMPSTWLDKFNAWRYLAMLGNTRTHIRNFLGNAIFLPAIRIKDALGAIGERMFIKDVSHRTKVFKVNKKYREYAMKDFEEVKGLLTRGGKMNPSDIVQDRRKIFTSKLFAPVEKFRKFNFDALELEDLIFLKKHYIHALGSVLQSRGLDVNNITEQQLKDARDYAINEAQKATYRDFSFFANMLNKLAHPTKNGKPVRDVATKGLAVLVEGALPFKKTPINILKRGIEYSPIGIATSIGNAIIAGRRGEFSGAEFIDGITAGMTGTMIMGLGMLLQSMGWLVGGLGYDDEDALERLSGAQPYAIDFGEFARDLGFDVDGGVSYTIDWMAPSSLPLLIGAEVSKALAQDEDGQISDLLLAIAEPMTELSFLQGVNDIIEGVAYSGENGLGVTGEVLTNLASTYVSQYFPTLTGQVARTFDDTRRANFVDKSSAVPKTLQKTAQKILGKIPFAENQKIPYIDAWGRTEENDNFLLRAFENFVSPGYVSKIEDDKVNNELAKVYTNTGESGVIPKKAGTSFPVNGKMVYLDAEKYVQYATDKGQYSRRYLEEMMSSGLYNGLSSDGKAEAIAFLFSYANAKAKSNVSDYDYREVSTYKTAAKLEDAGISPASYAVAKFAMSKENADTDGSGSVSKSEKRKALRNAGFSSRDANKILNINNK